MAKAKEKREIATGIPLSQAMVALTDQLTEQKTSEGNSDEENVAIARILSGDRAYSGPLDIAKGFTMEFKSLTSAEYESAGKLAITNYKDIIDPETKGIIPGSKLQIDMQAQATYCLVYAMHKINDVLVTLPQRPTMSSTEEEHKAYMLELNKTVQIIFNWPKDLRRNVFLQCSNFLKKIESLFKVDALVPFYEPPSDSSSEKGTEGETGK